MDSEILLAILEQNRTECFWFCKDINDTNSRFRLNAQTASVGFVYRHLGEVMNLATEFYGKQTAVVGSTIGKIDSGERYDVAISRQHIESGYNALGQIVRETSGHDWLTEIETSWFGKISKIKLLSTLLFHNSHHCGQISATLKKGKLFNENS
jgi:hypothetical protein